ncbi:GreA/GreB family elongation factor [Roseivirga sp. E12]|uniref:GreA/GreB family elongation factor n=1 Tax=Roseivirga sp. E12 TaxID=2819237 RepID=UPI001ABCB029|nr:GreA/GreB family elongation factor [Roseivirga sp. E12]MBO3698647.1 GreA/GreB family elongation factor [Roseivirga sp. E12]
MSALKQELLNHCLSNIEERIDRLEQEMEALKRSAESDTKSSMGDKYETGREMINLEKGKIAEQLNETIRMRQALLSIDADKKNEIGALGALITTAQAMYFMATSIGKVSLGDQDFFVISPVSPIGQQLLNKKVGDQISFAGKEIALLNIE